MRGPVGRRWAVWLTAVVLLAGVSRAVIALPERCAPEDETRLATAAGEAVAWFERNQLPDGTWRYRLDLDTGEDLGGYNWVRHAGVMLSLEQAATAGLPGAGAIAERARPAILDRLVAVGDRLALDDAGSLTTGGTALLTVALAEHRLTTGDPADDDRLRALGRYLAGQVEPDGSVLNTASVDGAVSVPGSFSPFATGQVLFALARLERIFPGEGFGAPVRRISDHLAHRRALEEGYVPEVSDHWAAYGYAEVVRWPAPENVLTRDELAFARKQMGLHGIEVRYESQRTNEGVDRWLRGRRTSGAGVGTLGEGLWRWGVVAAAEPALAGDRGWIHDRLGCAASLVAHRQIDPAEAAARPDPSAARGAFEQFGITQMDDQQHSLSTLLGGMEAAASPPQPLPRRTPVPESALLATLVALAALNPVRLARLAHRHPAPGRPAGAAAIVIGVLLVAASAVAGGPLLRALDVSAATAVMAGGLSVAVAGMATLAWPRVPGRAVEGASDGTTGPSAGMVLAVLVPAVARPELLLLALGVGAGGRGWALSAGVVLGAAGAGLLLALRARTGTLPPGLVTWSVRLLAVGAVAGGVALIVDGVYAI